MILKFSLYQFIIVYIQIQRIILDGVSFGTLKVCSRFGFTIMWQQGWKYVKESCAAMCLIK